MVNVAAAAGSQVTFPLRLSEAALSFFTPAGTEAAATTGCASTRRPPQRIRTCPHPRPAPPHNSAAVARRPVPTPPQPRARRSPGAAVAGRCWRQSSAPPAPPWSCSSESACSSSAAPGAPCPAPSPPRRRRPRTPAHRGTRAHRHHRGRQHTRARLHIRVAGAQRADPGTVRADRRLVVAVLVRLTVEGLRATIRRKPVL
ncbi:MAG TPA: hypothetical protein VG184_05710 [Acidimicrobiales bacterium]|nr:hypothetical protein [Acidimicrobiales bacterium]